MAESDEVRLARIEERMVMLVTTQTRMEKKLDIIADAQAKQGEKHHEVSAKVLALAGSCSILVTIVATMLIKVMGH